MSATPPPKMSAPLEGPSRPPQRNSTSVILTVVGVVVALGCIGGVVMVAILLPVFKRARGNAVNAMRGRQCVSHLRSLATNVSLYASEYDDALPISTHWMDEIQQVGANERQLHCPEIIRLEKHPYGYAYHSILSSKKKSSFGADTWLICDSTMLTRNAASTNETTPKIGRHPFAQSRINNVVLLDGTSKAEYTAAAPSTPASAVLSSRQ